MHVVPAESRKCHRLLYHLHATTACAHSPCRACDIEICSAYPRALSPTLLAPSDYGNRMKSVHLRAHFPRYTCASLKVSYNREVADTNLLKCT